MRIGLHWILGGVAITMLACGGEEGTRTGRSLATDTVGVEAMDAALNVAPVIESLVLSPDRPRPGERVVAEVRSVDANGDAVSLTYVWRVDGAVQQETGDRLHVQGERGARIEVEVTPRDGVAQGTSATAVVEVGNMPPVIHGVAIRPRSGVVPGRKITAEPKGTDADGDALEFEYQWFVSGTEVFGNHGPVLEPDAFGAGDEIRVGVVASDGSDTSDPLMSDPIAVGNALPRITSAPPGQFEDDGTFRYAIRVEDADDSSFRFKLLEGPDGMELDLFDGQLTWAPVEAQAGRHAVKIEVTDRKGAAVTQRFAVEVGFETESLPASPAP